MDEQAATISVEQASKRLGIGRALGYQLARNGTLPGVLSLGEHRLLVSRVQLERFLEGESDPARTAAIEA